MAPVMPHQPPRGASLLAATAYDQGLVLMDRARGSLGHDIAHMDDPVQAGSPFAEEIPRDHARGAVWVQPLLVVDVAFAAWTPKGRLRAASYQGLRDAKDPTDVIHESRRRTHSSRNLAVAGG
jgi:ATP dependent DNA ligase C terminal region